MGAEEAGHRRKRDRERKMGKEQQDRKASDACRSRRNSRPFSKHSANQALLGCLAAPIFCAVGPQDSHTST